MRVVSPPLALVPPPESALECEREEGIVLGRLHIGVDDETVLNDEVKVRCNARDNRRVEDSEKDISATGQLYKRTSTFMRLVR
jgi:hypothetical protein